jgi:hypothetical protein
VLVTVGDPLSSNGGLHAINKEIGKAQLRMAQETSPTDSPTVLTVCEILFITGALPKNPRISLAPLGSERIGKIGAKMVITVSI